MAKLELINESSLNRLLDKHFHDGFIIVTSNRNENSKIENKLNFEELKKIVKNHLFSYIPVFGGFRETNKETKEKINIYEPSLLITNYKIGTNHPYDDDTKLFHLGITLINRYRQESFLYKPKESDFAYYINGNGNVVQKFTGKSINDLTTQFFTDLFKITNTPPKHGGYKKAERRFVFTHEIYMQESPEDMSEATTRYGEEFFRFKPRK